MYAVFSSETRELLLSSVDLYEAIDSLTWPARKAMFRDAKEVADPHSLGDPRYDVQCRLDGSREVIHIGIKAPESRPGNQDAERSSQVRESLLQRSPVLRERVAQNRIELCVSVVDDVEVAWGV
jgi:hypothetical protein